MSQISAGGGEGLAGKGQVSVCVVCMCVYYGSVEGDNHCVFSALSCRVLILHFSQVRRDRRKREYLLVEDSDEVSMDAWEEGKNVQAPPVFLYAIFREPSWRDWSQ